MKSYRILPIGFFCLLAFQFSTSAAGQPLPEALRTTNSLFLPTPDLVFGPNITQLTSLQFRLATINSSQDVGEIIIYNPDIFLNRVNTSHIPTGKDLNIDLGSFFFLNRQAPQIIPQESKISMNMSKILNPSEAADITQMRFGDSITIPQIANDMDQSRVFQLPTNIEPGDYLVDVSFYYPSSQVEATYSNRITVEGANTTIQNSND